MRYQTTLHESGQPVVGVTTAALQDTQITIDIENHSDFGILRRISVVYTFRTQGNAEVVHVFQFCSDDYHNGPQNFGTPTAWNDFVDLITSDDDPASLAYYAKRSFETMSEFAYWCLGDKQAAAAA